MLEKKQQLAELAEKALSMAKAKGATSAEVSSRFGEGLSVEVRMSQVDKLEYHRDQGLNVTVYFGQCSGHASTGDISDQGIQSTVDAACSIAKFTSEDEFSGLADAELMATEFPDLDLYHPWEVEAADAISLARECEDHARAYSPLITNADGTSLSSYQGTGIYANSHGFIGNSLSSRHSLSCSMVAQEGDSMQRDYWYTLSRQHENMQSAQQVGEYAAKRAIERLNGRQIETCSVPVLYAPEVARSLLGHYMGAVNGGALYRQASFLMDSLGQRVFPEFVNLREYPLLPRELGSAVYDKQGVARREGSLVESGCVATYIMGAYSAKKLGMKTSAHAGGVTNLRLDSTGQNFKELLSEMNTGFLVTELMGSSVNQMNGDYSRGASGYWVENGEIQFPVEEVTVAGNLKTMFQQIVAIGNDVDTRGSMHNGSILIEQMTIAGK